MAFLNKPQRKFNVQRRHKRYIIPDHLQGRVQWTCNSCHTNIGHGRKLCWFCTNLKKRYKVTYSEFEQLKREQENRCKICKKFSGGRRLSIDHNHETGRVRGLLCYKCNTAIGLMDSSSFERARAYLDYEGQIGM